MALAHKVGGVVGSCQLLRDDCEVEGEEVAACVGAVGLCSREMIGESSYREESAATLTQETPERNDRRVGEQ